MSHSKPPERRTFLQDRFEILIKRQQSGAATFNELTELDDMVNRDPELREKVIRESIFMEGTDDFAEPFDKHSNEDNLVVGHTKSKNLFTRMKEFLARIFVAKITIVKNSRISYRANQLLMV
jgi:hypothetical protein